MMRSSPGGLVWLDGGGGEGDVSNSAENVCVPCLCLILTANANVIHDAVLRSLSLLQRIDSSTEITGHELESEFDSLVKM